MHMRQGISHSSIASETSLRSTGSRVYIRTSLVSDIFFGFMYTTSITKLNLCEKLYHEE